jgi:hypothetical protein
LGGVAGAIDRFELGCGLWEATMKFEERFIF